MELQQLSRIVSVNYHLYKPCNLHCRFCFATFRDVRGALPLPDAFRLMHLLREAGCEKLNFAGGEPTLHPQFPSILAEARRLGFVTSIVTNGARLKPLLEHQSSDIDWVGFSIDSAREDTQAALGRGTGSYVRDTLELVNEARARGVKIKLNTVVTRLTWDEDMTALVRVIRPRRWKVFQVLAVEGQNDGDVEDLLITGDQFRSFIDRHAHLDSESMRPVPEDNDGIIDSYVMIDPLGRFYGDHNGIHNASDRIIDVGINAALDQMHYRPQKLAARGGIYDWGAPRGSQTLQLRIVGR